MTLMFSASAFLISAMTLLISASALLYCTIPTAPTVPCTCYSFLLVYASKNLYEKYMNSDQYAYKNKNL